MGRRLRGILAVTCAGFAAVALTRVRLSWGSGLGAMVEILLWICVGGLLWLVGRAVQLVLFER